MKTKIYRKVCQILRLIELKDDSGYVEKYVIEIRDNVSDPWKNVFESPALKKALMKKHYYLHFAMRHLGYGSAFLQKQKKRRALAIG